MQRAAVEGEVRVEHRRRVVHEQRRHPFARSDPTSCQVRVRTPASPLKFLGAHAVD
jgi:hypothetical protein